MSAISHSTLARSRESLDPIHPSLWRDLAIVVTVAVLTFLFASVFQLNERMVALSRPLEPYQVDELPITFLAMVLALAWFAWRRSKQLLAEADLRIEVQRALAAAVQENRLLSQRYMQLQEDERRELARELHDELGQSLNAIKVDAVFLRDQPLESAQVRKSAEAIVDLSTQVYDTVRSLMRQLRPVALDELGLVPAVQYGIEQWQRRYPAVRCEFTAQGTLDGLDEKLNITVYRLVQECLTNVAKHASARSVRIAIARSAEPGALTVHVVDDGKGFEPAARGQGLGLIGLRERVEALDGTFAIKAAPGQGVSIEVSIPLLPKP
jgi:two-component system, NarL family, sensor histidine kinase UhpB